MELTNIQVTYCSNYNGCYLRAFVNEEQIDPSDYPEIDEQFEECSSDIIDEAVDQCDDDGCFYGDLSKLKEFCITTVKAAFGDQVNVTFEEDSVST